MKANAVNFHILVTRDTDVIAKIGKFDLENSREKKLLGLKIDTKLFFENHVSPQKDKPYATCSRKFWSLMKAFITFQFNYCP